MSRPGSAFAIRDFRLITQSRFLFSFAVQIQAIVMGWQMYEIKKDPLYLGLIGLAEAAPALTLALIAGYIVDRSEPLKSYKYVMRTSLVSAALLLGVSSGWAGVPESQWPFWIFAAAFITGVARGFASPSLYALMPQIVPRETLNVSSAWITSVFQIAAVAGPAAGGILYAWKGAWLPYGVDVAMLVAAIASLALVEIRPKVNPNPSREPMKKALTSGLRFVFGHQLLLAALAMDMFAVFFGGVEAILPLFSGDILHTGAIGLGILRAAPAVGAFILSALLIRFPVSRSAGRILLAVVAGFGVCMVAFALSKSMWLSCALLAVAGGLDAISMVIRTSIVQLCSPDDMRGRIAAVNSIFIGSSNELGAFESGVAAKFLGTVPSVILGGCLTLLTVGATALAAPKLREMDLAEL